MLRSYTWERAKSECKHYRRRSPEHSELYRIVYPHREDFEHCWNEKFQYQYGNLRKEVIKTLDDYLNYGILEHGAAHVYCDSASKPCLQPSLVKSEEYVPVAVLSEPSSLQSISALKS